MDRLRNPAVNRRSTVPGAFALLALLALQSASAADGHSLSMWQITGAANRVYLLGSVHLLRETDHPLPSAIFDAYDDADTLIMELDMDDLDPVETQALVNDLGMIKGGGSLVGLIGADLYAEAEQIAAEFDIPLAMLSGTEPWYAAVTIEQLMLMKIGFDPGFGIESQLVTRASADDKEILGLERIDEQLGFLDSMSLEAQRELFMQSLRDGANIESLMDDLIDAWRMGDIDFLEESMLSDMRDYPELYERLVVARNRNWVEQIQALLEDDENYLVVVGALHLVGNDGVPNMLIQRGNKLVQMRQSQ